MAGKFDDKVVAALISGLDTLRTGVAVFDGDDVMIYCNEHYRFLYQSFDSVHEIIGLTYEQFQRQNVEDGVIAGGLATADPDRWVKDRVKRHKKASWHPIIEQLADGRWIETKERAIPEGGVISISADVSARVNANRRLQDAVLNFGEGFALWDQSGRLMICNDRFIYRHAPRGSALEPGMRYIEVMEGLAKAHLVCTEMDEEAFAAHRLTMHRTPTSDEVYEYTDGRWILIKERRTRDGGTATILTDVTEMKSAQADVVKRYTALAGTMADLNQAHDMIDDQAEQISELARALDEAGHGLA